MTERTYTDRAALALERAIEEADGLGHKYIGTEHLLLGLLRVDGIATGVLEHLGVDLEKVREGIYFVIGHPKDPA